MLRRTKNLKFNGRPILELPTCEVNTEMLDLTEVEKKIYSTFHSQAESIFQQYRRNNEINKNYIHIFELLLRLRQLCDHIFLVLFSVLQDKTDYDAAYHLAQEIEKEIREGNLSTIVEVMGKIFNSSNICTICYEEFIRPTYTKW